MREYKNTRNPILPPDIHIPDGEGHVMPDGRLYIYGSYDEIENELINIQSKNGGVFKDFGTDYYNQFNKEYRINTYFKKLKVFGRED